MSSLLPFYTVKKGEKYVNWKHYHLEDKLLAYPVQQHAQLFFIITVVSLLSHPSLINPQPH